MSYTDDMTYCAEAIRQGSRSFHAASKLLPKSVRDPALALYAFCRLADDAVDLQEAKREAVLRLHERLDKAFAGTPENAPADRAFAAIIEEFEMPRALPEALLEGLAWDAMNRRHATLSELRAYSARVASAVGAMMCVLMRVRDRDALARACDLGVAMQLTNIARDVGEDAREGRLYLPTEWLDDAGIDTEAFLANPTFTPEIAVLVKRLLFEADQLYVRSEAGIGALPVSSRPGIFAARYIYAGIGKALRRKRMNSIDHRAHTNAPQKMAWLMLASTRAAATMVMPRSPVLRARSLPETAFLVDAAADHAARAPDWSDALYSTLASLKTRDIEQDHSFVPEGAPLRMR
ncbi:MAG: 15-cis-phytoene synthase [Roseovarius sp.]